MYYSLIVALSLVALSQRNSRNTYFNKSEWKRGKSKAGVVWSKGLGSGKAQIRWGWFSKLLGKISIHAV